MKADQHTAAERAGANPDVQGQAGLDTSWRAARMKMTTTSKGMPEPNLSDNEHEMLRQLIVALRSLRYGSVVLTVHDGQLVEIQKIEKIRMRNLKPKI